MSQVQDFTRFISHIEGSTYLTYNQDGKNFITGGFDGLLKYYQTDKVGIQEPTILQYQCDPITGVQFTDQKLFVSSEAGQLIQLSKAKFNFEKIIYQSQNPIRKLFLSSNKLRVCCIDSEFNVKLISIFNTSDVVELKSDNKIVSVVYHPMGFQIAGIDVEGNLLVWDLLSNEGRTEAQLSKTIENSARMNIDINAGDRCLFGFNGTGSQLAVPDHQNQIHIYDTKNYSVVNTLPQETSPIVAIKYSPNSQYLAYATDQPEIKVVSCTNWETVRTFPANFPITDMSWNPKLNQIACTDNEGGLIFLNNVIDIHTGLINPIDRVELQQFYSAPPPQVAHQQNQIEKFEDSDHDLEDDQISETKKSASSHQQRPRFGHNQKSIINPNHESRMPFIPGCFESEKLNRSSLHYSMDGLITLTYLDDTSYIQAEYLDKGKNQGFTVTNVHDYNMGYIGDYGVLLGKSSSRRKDVNFFSFNSTAMADEDLKWGVQFPKGSQLIGLCLAKTGPVAITSDCRMHWFDRSGGTIRVQMTHHHHFVAVSAHHNGHVLFIYTDGLRYKFAIVDAQSPEEIRAIMPLSDLHIPYDQQIMWAGFSDDAMPIIYTSKGLFMVFQESARGSIGTWHPVIDLKLEKEGEFYFPIGGTFGQVYCVKIDPNDRWLFRPEIFDLAWNLPILKTDTSEELSKLEKSLSSNLLIVQLIQSQSQLSDEQFEVLNRHELEKDKLVLKLVHSHCQQRSDSRVLELVQMLKHDADIRNAIRLIEHVGHYDLSTKVQEYLNDRQLNGLSLTGDKRVGDHLNGRPFKIVK